MNQITEAVIGAAMAVHRALGPGLLESAYEACLVHELAQQGVKVERQKAMPVKYAGVNLDCGYRLDLLVEGCVPVELKAVDRIERIHEVQLLSYLRLSGCEVGGLALLCQLRAPEREDGAAGILARRAVAKNGHRAPLTCRGAELTK